MKKLLILSTILYSTTSMAASINNQAKVELVQPIQITAHNDMNFGRIVKPETGSETVTIGYNNNLFGTAQIISDAGAKAGTATISGSPDDLVSITITDSTNVNGLALDNFTSSFNGFTSTDGDGITESAIIPAGGGDISIGARLTIDSSAPTGEVSPSYNIEVNYN